MEQIETQVRALVDAVEAENVEAAKAAIVGLAVGVLGDVRRIADSLERLAKAGLLD